METQSAASIAQREASRETVQSNIDNFHLEMIGEQLAEANPKYELILSEMLAPLYGEFAEVKEAIAAGLEK